MSIDSQFIKDICLGDSNAFFALGPQGDSYLCQALFKLDGQLDNLYVYNLDSSHDTRKIEGEKALKLFDKEDYTIIDEVLITNNDCFGLYVTNGGSIILSFEQDTEEYELPLLLEISPYDTNLEDGYHVDVQFLDTGDYVHSLVNGITCRETLKQHPKVTRLPKNFKYRFRN